MFDLRDLEKRLQNDPKLRDEFLQDPVGSLQKEGVTLPPHMEKQLEQHAHHIRSKSGPHEAGIAISISVSY